MLVTECLPSEEFSPIHLLTQFFPFCRFWLPLLLPFLLPLLVAVLQGRIIAWYNIAGLKRLAGNPSPLMIGSLHLPCIYRKQTRYGKEGACPPSRQAQDKFACRREGRPDHFSSLKTVRVLRDLFVAFVINKRSSLLFARWCWEIFSLAAMAALCSLPVRRSEAGCPASVVDRKILKPCQIIPFRAIMLTGPIRGCLMKSPYWAQNSQPLNFWLSLTSGTHSVRVKRQDGSGKLLLPAPCSLLLAPCFL